MSSANGDYSTTLLGGRYVKDEIVVGLPYEALVLSRLTNWRAAPDPQDADPRLGLRRVLLDAAAAVRHLQTADAGRVADARAAARADADAAVKAGRLDAATAAAYTPSDLDLLSRCLRSSFQQDYSGWMPTFAKNRVVERRVGYPPVAAGDTAAPAGNVTPNSVIDMGAFGGSRPVVDPQHVIDMGTVTQGVGRPRPAGVVYVDLRRAAPGRGVRVGIVDTRLAAHPWLAGAYVASPEDMYAPGESPSKNAEAGHATFVAGLILRQAPGAELVLRADFDEDGHSDSWSVARSIATLAGQGLDVLNLSLGCATDDGLPPLVLTAALAAVGPNTVVVASAGNHERRPDGSVPVPSWPGALDGVVCVGALDDGQPAVFSPPVPWVDVYAPGVRVASTCYLDSADPGAFGRWSGTSFAAATVSGAIAARAGRGRSARGAWEELRGHAAKVDDLPVIRATTPDGWPPDDPAGRIKP